MTSLPVRVVFNVHKNITSINTTVLFTMFAYYFATIDIGYYLVTISITQQIRILLLVF